MRLALMTVLICAFTAGPADKKPTGGVITGTIQPSGWVKSVSAIDRAAKTERPGRFDHARGEFIIDALEPQHRYDLRIITKFGTIDGVHLSPPKHLLPPDSATSKPLSERDKQKIRNIISSVEQFEDQVRMLFVDGSDQYASALVDKLRTRPFHGMSGNQVIWRVEIWQFAWHYGGWMRTPNVETVLIRKRLQRREFDKITWLFDPSLGGIVASNEPTAKPLVIKLRRQFDERFGRLAKDFDRKVLAPATSPTSRPAR